MIFFIFGSRHFYPNEKAAYKAIRTWVSDAINSAKKTNSKLLIIHGGAIGADTIAGKVADKKGIRSVVVRPNYEKYGRFGAPHRRNDFVLRNADKAMAFWNGDYEGSGTASVILKCYRFDKDVFSLTWDGEKFVETDRLRFMVNAPEDWKNKWMSRPLSASMKMVMRDS